MMMRIGGVTCDEAWRARVHWTAATSKSVQTHLAICSRCYPRYNPARYFEYTRRLREREQASPALRHQLFARLLAQEGAAGEGA